MLRNAWACVVTSLGYPCRGSLVLLVQLKLSMQMTGLAGQTAAHIHVGPAGGSGPAVVVLPVGSFTDALLQLDSATVAQMLAGNAYINVHTTAYPGGEFCTASSVCCVQLCEMELC
jgi:hypothetical protein